MNKLLALVSCRPLPSVQRSRSALFATRLRRRISQQEAPRNGGERLRLGGTSPRVGSTAAAATKQPAAA